ncbi:MAG TPA: HAD-IC family P-type ATPase [Caulobacteraceae bacterium]|nr:HAD-IC family P-type ATPase [Caulobacteraceae bacterium]
MQGRGWWAEPAAAALAAVGGNETGLSSAEAASRLKAFGRNDAATPRRPGALVRFAGRFANPLVAILLFASALSALTGDVASFVVVAAIVVLSVSLDFLQESRAQEAVDALRAQVALRAMVTRDGRETSLPVAELVPGDIVRLAAGDLVPADGLVLEARDFFLNQALLTGESYPVEKSPRPQGDAAAAIGEAANAALAGASVVSGSARMVVIETGKRAALGQIAASLAAKAPPTDFEVGLRRFGMLLIRITLVLVLVVMAESMAFHRPWLESLLFALALAVGLTPELLPMIVTITLARGAIRLSKERVIVKRLPAIHNLGALDVLCTDKTGTLTEARISLDRHIESPARRASGC